MRLRHRVALLAALAIALAGGGAALGGGPRATSIGARLDAVHAHDVVAVVQAPEARVLRGTSLPRPGGVAVDGTWATLGTILTLAMAVAGTLALTGRAAHRREPALTLRTSRAPPRL